MYIHPGTLSQHSEHFPHSMDSRPRGRRRSIQPNNHAQRLYLVAAANSRGYDGVYPVKKLHAGNSDKYHAYRSIGARQEEVKVRG